MAPPCCCPTQGVVGRWDTKPGRATQRRRRVRKIEIYEPDYSAVPNPHPDASGHVGAQLWVNRSMCKIDRPETQGLARWPWSATGLSRIQPTTTSATSLDHLNARNGTRSSWTAPPSGEWRRLVILHVGVLDAAGDPWVQAVLRARARWAAKYPDLDIFGRASAIHGGGGVACATVRCTSPSRLIDSEVTRYNQLRTDVDGQRPPGGQTGGHDVAVGPGGLGRDRTRRRPDTTASGLTYPFKVRCFKL